MEDTNIASTMAGQKVVIIGGSSGIGLASAELVHRLGGEVVIAGRNEAQLEEAVASLGDRVDSCVLDVRDARSLDVCLEAHSPFDHLVVTVGEVRPGPFLEQELEDARQVFEVKFWGQYAAAQLAAPCIRSGGSITLFSGVAAHRPVRGLAVSAAADGAVEALVRSLAIELRPIRVNAVSPGFIDTHGMNDERRERIASSLPVGRVGTAADVARGVLGIINNGFVTGTVLVIDGGYHAS